VNNYLRETYEDIIKASTLEQCWSLTLDTLTQFGLSEGMVVWINDGIDQPKSFNYLCSYSGSFLDDYLYLGGGANDPCVQVPVRYRNKSSLSGPLIKWKDIDHWLSKQPTSEFASAAMEELSETYKLHSGYTAVFADTLNSPLFGVGIGGPSLTENEFNKLTVPNYDTISTIICLFGALVKRHTDSLPANFINNKAQNRSKQITLTAREKDILEWLADGHKLQTIADDYLHRSLSTLNKDLNQLKHKMSAKTIDELIAKALLGGLIQ
jgi:DNA-binding CsgD family transcriptional regulator